jgi:hypothetical protein
MKPDDPDGISLGRPSTGTNRIAWAVVALLSAALAIAIIVAVHYRGEVTAARQQSRAARAHGGSHHARLMLSGDTVALPSSGMLTGEVTVVAVRSSARLAQVIVTARISGGRPHSQYELSGGDCTGNAADHAWAIATTNAHGSADLTGHAWPVSVSHEYYLVVGTPGRYREHPGPAVHGQFGMARGLSVVQRGVAPCAP